MSRLLNKIKKDNFLLKIIETFIGKGAYSIFTLLFTFICAKLYGAEVLGEFTFAFTIITILAIFSTMGLDNGLIYSLANTDNRQVSFGFLLNFLLSIVLIIVVYWLNDNSYLNLMLPVVWLYSLELLFFSLYRHEGKFKQYYIINGFLGMFIRVILVVIFYFTLGKDSTSLLYALIISLVVVNLLYFKEYKRMFGKIYFEKTLIYMSLPLLLTNVTALLIGKMDILMLKFFSTTSSVGIFQVILQITGIIAVVLSIFISVLAPRFAKLFKDSNIKELKELYIRSSRILLIIGLTFSSIIILFSEKILLIFGREFIVGKYALIFMCIGQFINVAVGAVWTLMAMSGKPKFQMYANLCALIANFLMNFLLIPIYGISGAGFASMFTIALTNIIGYIVVKKMYNINVFKVI